MRTVEGAGSAMVEGMSGRWVGSPARSQASALWCYFFRAVNGQLGHDFAYAEKQEGLAGFVQCAFVTVLFGQGQRGNEDLIVEAHEWVGLQELNAMARASSWSRASRR